MISIVIPIHNMVNKDFFLQRCLKSIEKQTFKDYEIIINEEGKFAENVNSAMKKCKGELIKFLCMDDWLAEEYSLQKIVDNCPINEQTIIVEIGSGYGHLTELLAKTNCYQIISCEKDARLFLWLKNR